MKWDYLREVLMEKIVYDDVTHRAWYTDETKSTGLLFACKQARVQCSLCGTADGGLCDGVE